MKNVEYYSYLITTCVMAHENISTHINEYEYIFILYKLFSTNFNI